MTSAGKAPAAFRSALRGRVARSFTLVEDVVYVGLGLLLAGAAVVLLASLLLIFCRGLLAGTLTGSVISLLDQALLILMIVTPCSSPFGSTSSSPSPSSWSRSSRVCGEFSWSRRSCRSGSKQGTPSFETP